MGGLAGGYDFHNHDWSIEKFYHHWFKNEKGIKEICSRLNIYNQIDFYSTKTSFLHSDGIKPFDKPTDVLSYPGLSIIEITRKQRDFDSVLLTVSPSILKKLLVDENDKYIRKVNQIPSVGAICMIIRLKRRVLKNSYWLNIPSVSTNPISNKVPFLIFVEHTNLIDPSYYNNEHIVYCANYLKKELRLRDQYLI